MEDTITESVFVSAPLDVVRRRFSEASDSVQKNAVIGGTRAVPSVASDSVVVDSALAFAWGSILREMVTIATAADGTGLYNLQLSSAIEISERLVAGQPVTLAEQLTLTAATQSVIAILIAEQIGISPALVGALIAQTTVAELVELQDSLAQFFGADITETLTVSATHIGQLLGFASIAETVEVTADMQPQLLINVIADDTVDVSAVEALNMVFSGVVDEAFEVRAAYLAPQGTFTAWAMNTLTAEVSEYSNYAFNGFARLGNAYVGTSADGIYELLGDTDAGSDIIATLKGGYIQFGGTHMSRLGAAYLGARGGGEFVLKIESADGATYTYAVDARSMRSTKVHMGKGQRARYFSFELISAGQDFDLDSIEFVPVVVQRRV